MTDRIDLPLEDILDRCLTRVLAGESPDDVLRDHPAAAEELRPLLLRAAALSAVPIPEPDGAARMAAMSRMLTASRDAAERYQPAGVFALLGSLRARPLAFQALAAAAAIAVLGSAGLGASAATGNTPEPVRTFFRLPDTSDDSVHARGAVVSASSSALIIDEDGTQRTFLLDDGTSVTRDGAHVAWSDLVAGEAVDVRAIRRADGALAARQVRAKELPAPAGATPDADGGTSSTNASPPAHTPDARETEHPDEGHSDRAPGSEDDGGGPSESETPKSDDSGEDGSGETEGTPPQSDATSTHGDGDNGEPDGSGPSATKTPEPTEEPESRTPEHDHTPSSDDDHTPKP